MPECGAINPDYPHEPGCSLPKGHGPVIPSHHNDHGVDEPYEHANVPNGMYWNVPKPPDDPEHGTVPEADRIPLPLSVGPIKGVEPYVAQPFLSGDKARTMVAWALYVGGEPVTWDFVIGDSTEAAIARSLLRKWLGVRS